MMGALEAAEIETVLKRGIIGRIGCHAQNRTYVVPVTYAYDGEYVYAHSAEGLKVDLMRANPEVCFEVDTYTSLTNWRSVIAWGHFEELKGDDARRGM
ncbi:MAG TPA: pyridoxamine 5'-phosphate oxidase family protein, partial [bacterium]|nr:pyridoxamine 5'-phosphate oxidase family protein [bacterium]